MYITFAYRNANKAAHSGFETQSETSPEIQNRGTSGPKKKYNACPPKNFKKKDTV